MSNEYQTRAERIFEHMKSAAEIGGYNTDVFKDPSYKGIVVTHIAASLETMYCDGSIKGMGDAVKNFVKSQL